MSVLFLGVAIGLIPYAVHRLDRRLAEYKREPPIANFWSEHTYKIVRWRYGKQRQLTRWFVALGPVARVLNHRRWRVTYVRVCQYGNDPDQGGSPPSVAATSWHWTKRGAEWHRRHRPNYGGMWSFYAVTQIDKAPTEPFDVRAWMAGS